MARIEIRGVRRTFGSVTALKDVSLTVAPGEFMVLLGPSGCGKSTLLGAIAGLEPIDRGEIRIGERDVTRLEPKDRDIAMVFQSYALYPTMSVRDNITFGQRMRGAPRAEIAEGLARTARMLRIEDLLGRKPQQLSGGQRQRVAIGRALMRSPKAFLLDEPLSNLDAKLRAEMRIDIKQLHQQLGTTMVYVTHDQIEAMTLGTRIAVMRDGAVLQVGTPSDIYDRPATTFVAGFVGSPAMNMLEGRLRVTSDGVAVDAAGLRLPVGGYPFAEPPQDGRPVVVGLRPEAVSEPGERSAVRLEWTAGLVEPTGSDTLVRFDLGEAAITGRFHPSTPAKAGQPLPVGIDMSGASLFERETQTRL